MCNKDSGHADIQPANPYSLAIDQLSVKSGLISCNPLHVNFPDLDTPLHYDWACFESSRSFRLLLKGVCFVRLNRMHSHRLSAVLSASFAVGTELTTRM